MRSAPLHLPERLLRHPFPFPFNTLPSRPAHRKAVCRRPLPAACGGPTSISMTAWLFYWPSGHTLNYDSSDLCDGFDFYQSHQINQKNHSSDVLAFFFSPRRTLRRLRPPSHVSKRTSILHFFPSEEILPKTQQPTHPTTYFSIHLLAATNASTHGPISSIARPAG